MRVIKKPGNKIINLDERRYFKERNIPFFDLENKSLDDLRAEAKSMGLETEKFEERMLALIEKLKGAQTPEELKKIMREARKKFPLKP